MVDNILDPESLGGSGTPVSREVICLFNTTPFWRGGEKWCLQAAVGLRDRGHRVWLACSPGSSLLERAAAEGLETASFPVSNMSMANPALVHRMSRFFRAHGIQTVLFNNPRDLKAGGLAARIAGVPQRVYFRQLALPVKNRWLNRFLFKNILTGILTNSEATKRLLLQNLGAAVDEDQIQVLYHGIDLDAFDAQPLTPVFERRVGEIVLGNLGRLTPQKGQSLLIDIARILKDRGYRFRLVIAGDGEADELWSKVVDLDLTAEVELLGFVEDVPNFLRGIDVFVLSSLWEGFGYVIVEAGAARKPVVAFDLSSNPEVIEHGATGFLVPPANLEAFADRVQELIDGPELRARMGAAARHRTESLYQAEREIVELERYLWRHGTADGAEPTA